LDKTKNDFCVSFNDSPKEPLIVFNKTIKAKLGQCLTERDAIYAKDLK